MKRFRTTTIGGAARRRLDAARLVGCAAIASMAQFAVDAPDGYFGPVDRMTRVGAGFLAIVSACALVGAALRLRGHRGWLAPMLVQFGAVLAAFVPALPVDPIASGTVILWHLAIFGRLVVPGPPVLGGPIRDPAGESHATRTWRSRNAAAVAHLLIVSLLVAVASLGFRPGGGTAESWIVLGLGVAAVGLAAPFLLATVRSRPTGPIVVAVLLAGAATSAAAPNRALSILAFAQVVVLALLWKRTRLFRDLLEGFYRRPAHLVVASFVLLIAIGTLFLSFPAASAGPRPIAPIDALFTATSASCVTGLIVLDTPGDFSPFGQAVILALIQIGGLNIMVLSAFAAVLLGRGLGLRGEGAVGDVLGVEPGRSVRRLVLFIVGGTLAVESVGAVALTAIYLREGLSATAALGHGLFHAVSAFCNAGFALHSDSLVRFRSDPLVLGVVATLITLGGLGFGVLNALWTWPRSGLRGSPGVHARIVLVASIALVAVGASGYAALEWNRSLAGLPPVDRISNALFQSVTLRTAGFNTVPLDSVSPATELGMMAWMFVGASPGGTGGGIKTTTLVVLFGSIAALVGRRNRIVAFGHRLSLDTVYRSAAIAVVGSVVVAAGAFALLATQDRPFDVLLFEAFSAFGTVGLSLGATAALDGVGKAIVVVLMLAGRVGPLTLALLLGRDVWSRVGYPEARIMVG